jgi:transposase-like protein
LHKCPYCWQDEYCIKSGLNRNGTQRYRCRRCKRYSTAKSDRKRSSRELQARAVRLYLDGMSLRAVARLLGVHHQTVGRWVASRTRGLREEAIKLYLESESVDYASYYLSIFAKVNNRTVSMWIRAALPQSLKEQALSLRLKKTPLFKIKMAIGVDDERTVRKWIEQAKSSTIEEA